MVMLVVIVGMGLAALMLPLVLVQTHTTTFDSTRGRALQAAESGIDIAVGQIRAATTSGSGDFGKLPCVMPDGYDATDDDTKKSTAASDGSSGSEYGAQISYFQSDPARMTEIQRDTNKLSCVDGSGVTTGLPRYAMITATGFAPNEVRSRTLSATYVLLMPGLYDFSGQIRLYAPDNAGPDDWLCITADLTPRSDGHYPVTLQPCGQPVPDSQKFHYDSEYGIQLDSKIGADAMCLKTAGQSGTDLELSKCTGGSWIRISSAYYGQQLRAPDTNNKGISDLCFQTTSDATGAQVSLQTCAAFGSFNQLQAWDPDIEPSWPIVDGQQLMNLESGRCLDLAVLDDISGFLPTFTYSCMFVPISDKTKTPPWDQVFAMVPAGGGVQLKATCAASDEDAYLGCPPSPEYCLTSAGTDGSAATMVPCNASDSRQIWSRYLKSYPAGSGDTDNSFTIQDSNKLCLEEGRQQVSIPPFHYAQGTVATCDGSPRQKWNVPDDERTKIEQELGQGASVKDLHEK
jgi:hypothetical protein